MKDIERKRPYGLDHVFRTGKFEKWTLHAVILDPDGRSWLRWCMDNLRGFELDNEALELLDRHSQ